MATTRPDRTASRVPLIVAALVLGGLVAVAFSIDRDPTGSPPGPSATSDDVADERAGDPTSAMGGPEGARSSADVPREIPPGVVLPDGSDIDGVVARSGDAWSATVSYTSSRPMDAVEAAIDAAVVEAGFASRERRTDQERRLQVYDGEDGATLTVNLRAVEAGTDVAVVVVSP